MMIKRMIVGLLLLGAVGLLGRWPPDASQRSLPAPLPAPGAAPVGRFEVSTDNATVFDHATGLRWQRAVAGPFYNVPNAQSYCAQNKAALPLSGWRLPTVEELLSLADLQESSPAIDGAAFPGMAYYDGNFWSGSPSVNSGTTWFVEFGSGSTGADSSFKHWARCVR